MYYIQCIWSIRTIPTYRVYRFYDRVWEKGQFHAKCTFFKWSPLQGLKSPRLPTWFFSSLGLLLHRSNVRSYSKPPVLSSGAENGNFWTWLTWVLTPPTPKVGGARNLPRVYLRVTIICRYTYFCDFGLKYVLRVLNLQFVRNKAISTRFAVLINTVQPRLSEPSIIRTRDAKKMQGQSTYYDHVTNLCMRSKPTSHSCHARTSCCAAIKSSSNAQRNKGNAR